MEKAIDMLNHVQVKYFIIALMSCFCLMGLPQGAFAETADVLNAQVQDTLSTFKSDVKGANEVLNEAKGILIFPRVLQGGFIIGGEYGEGALLIKGKRSDYYRIVSGSLGFQLGGQRKAVVIAFMTDPALAQFLNSSGWEVGADASAAVFVVGAEGSINSETLNQPIVAFVLDQKGLMYDLSLEGSKIKKIRK